LFYQHNVGKSTHQDINKITIDEEQNKIFIVKIVP